VKYEPANTNAEWTYILAMVIVVGLSVLVWHFLPHAILLVPAAVGKAFAPYIAALCFCLAAAAILWKFECRTTFDLNALKRLAAKTSPTSDLGPGFDPNRYDDAWAPPRGAAAFLDLHRLRVGSALTSEAFAGQLGERWVYTSRAPRHVQCLAVLFALHSNPDRRTEADEFRDALAVAHARKSTDEERTGAVRALLAPHLADTGLLAVIDGGTKGHAYVATAMTALISSARRAGGVLASAEFLWLKGVDRSLWYALNNVGRRAVHVEGAGAVAHFEAERLAGIPLGIPHTESAEAALLDWFRKDDVTTSMEARTS
jgi:hypothetical protein